MAKYIAEIQDASGNTVYPATQWGAITNPPTIPAATEIKVISLAATGGATDPCAMTIIGERFINLEFNGRYPQGKGQAIYWMDKKYAKAQSFTLGRNGGEQSIVLTIKVDGSICLMGNTDDTHNGIGSYGYSI